MKLHRIQFSAAAVFVSALVLSGCGSGGAGALPGSETAPTPSRNTTAAAAYGPNYVSSLDSMARWEQFPVTVAFVKDSHWTPTLQSIAVQGFNEWQAATNSTIRFSLVESSATANITVHFDPTENNSLTQLQWYPSTGQIVAADIRLGIADPSDLTRSLPPIDIQGAAAHEFGHALGINGHSPYVGDLMYPVRIADVNASPDPTQHDVDTMKYNYQALFPLPAGRAVGPLVTTAIVN